MNANPWTRTQDYSTLLYEQHTEIWIGPTVHLTHSVALTVSIIKREFLCPLGPGTHFISFTLTSTWSWHYFVEPISRVLPQTAIFTFHVSIRGHRMCVLELSKDSRVQAKLVSPSPHQRTRESPSPHQRTRGTRQITEIWAVFNRHVASQYDAVMSCDVTLWHHVTSQYGVLTACGVTFWRHITNFGANGLANVRCRRCVNAQAFSLQYSIFFLAIISCWLCFSCHCLGLRTWTSTIGHFLGCTFVQWFLVWTPHPVSHFIQAA